MKELKELLGLISLESLKSWVSQNPKYLTIFTLLSAVMLGFSFIFNCPLIRHVFVFVFLFSFTPLLISIVWNPVEREVKFYKQKMFLRKLTQNQKEILSEYINNETRDESFNIQKSGISQLTQHEVINISVPQRFGYCRFTLSTRLFDYLKKNQNLLS